jgi:Type I phosphodiesterase / nucleotide pyrophosphatase
MLGVVLLICSLSAFSFGQTQSSRGAERPFPKVSRVLLISIDALHALDLANFVKAHPDSTLARLSAQGVTYTVASSSKPSNAFPGTLALMTGGSPSSTGVWYEGTYVRELSAPGSNCATRGIVVVWNSSVDRNKALVDGGGIDPAKLPLDPEKGCTPVYPHSFLRTNTIFEIAHGAGLHTAWIDKHPTYEMLNGPSGKGLDDYAAFEVSASGASRSVQAAVAYDDLKVQALLNEINGKDHTGAKDAAVPGLFGTTLQLVMMAEKNVEGGYVDSSGTPSPVLDHALRTTDQSLGKIVAALNQRNLLDSTLIVVTARAGGSPMESRKHRFIPNFILEDIINHAYPGVLGLAYQDGTLASVWLKDQSQTAAVVKTLSLPQNELALDVQNIISGEALKLKYNDPLKDGRIPDIVITGNLGAIYFEPEGSFLSEYGGFSEEDTNVALLIAHPALSPRVIKTPVTTAQVAPSVLKALGLNPAALEAVVKEDTPLLPGLFP